MKLAVQVRYSRISWLQNEYLPIVSVIDGKLQHSVAMFILVFIASESYLGGKTKEDRIRVSGMGETELHIYHIGTFGLPLCSPSAAVLVKKGSFS